MPDADVYEKAADDLDLYCANRCQEVTNDNCDGVCSALSEAVDWLRQQAIYARQRDEEFHWGADPGHGGLTRHKGRLENCPAPDHDQLQSPQG